MQQLKSAMEATSSHGLPRMVTNKPIYVRVTWVLVFLLMLGLFVKGFSEFVVKLQTRQVTTSLDADSVDFQFPDIYACFENPMSGSYPSYAEAEAVAEINRQLNATAQKLLRYGVVSTGSNMSAKVFEQYFSFVYPQSLEYRTLVDYFAHRMEQSLISSDLLYKLSTGMPNRIQIQANSFIHPLFLGCIQWTVSKTATTENIVQYSSTFVLVAKLLVDTKSAEIAAMEPSLVSQVYADGTPVTVSDWSLSLEDFYTPDRSAGVRMFLTPPGEYPSDFVTSFSLCPGKHHTVEIGMTQQVYKDGQFDCVKDEPDVQFVNQYDQTPYNHSYSYSYCYYYEYHKQFQSLMNLSGDISPMPWELRGSSYILNVTNDNSFLNVYTRGEKNDAFQTHIAQIATDKCKLRKPCSTLDYSVSISSADWPTQSSLAPFVNSSIKQAWTKAKAKNLSVPALDFLLTGNASSVASYLRSNLLKVHFKPHRVLCDRVTFSIDYGLSNFISDIGGIMGIYLGMSLLTLCELLELAYDLIMVVKNRKPSNVKPEQSGASFDN